MLIETFPFCENEFLPNLKQQKHYNSENKSIAAFKGTFSTLRNPCDPRNLTSFESKERHQGNIDHAGLALIESENNCRSTKRSDCGKQLARLLSVALTFSKSSTAIT